MDKPMKWFYESTEEARMAYPLSRVKVGYDRLEDEWITADQVFIVRCKKPADLNQKENRE